ncbi:MAG: hypothetical protein ACW98K_08625 [Candidatus Kariarchaeaceae archaeon]
MELSPLILRINATFSMYSVISNKQRYQTMFFTEGADQALVDRSYDQLGNESYFAYLDTMFFTLPKTKRVSSKMLLVGGENDRFFTPKQFQSTAENYNAKCILYPNMSHNPLHEPYLSMVAEDTLTWIQSNLNKE